MPPCSDIPILNFMSGTPSFVETALSPFTTLSSLSTTNKEFKFDNGGELEKTEDIKLGEDLPNLFPEAEEAFTEKIKDESLMNDESNLPLNVEEIKKIRYW